MVRCDNYSRKRASLFPCSTALWKRRVTARLPFVETSIYTKFTVECIFSAVHLFSPSLRIHLAVARKIREFTLGRRRPPVTVAFVKNSVFLDSYQRRRRRRRRRGGGRLSGPFENPFYFPPSRHRPSIISARERNPEPLFHAGCSHPLADRAHCSKQRKERWRAPPTSLTGQFYSSRRCPGLPLPGDV